MMKTSTLESFFLEGRPFAELLPYYTHENGFFVLKDASLGQVWELSFIEAEAKDSAHLEQLANNMEGLLTRLPEARVSAQFILLCDDDLEDRIELYKDKGQGFDNDIVKMSNLSKLDHLRKGRDGFFEEHAGKYCSKRIRLFFTLRHFFSWSASGFGEKVSSYFTGKDNIGKRHQDDFLVNCQSMDRACETVEGIFRGSEIKYSKLRRASFINCCISCLIQNALKRSPSPYLGIMNF